MPLSPQLVPNSAFDLLSALVYLRGTPFLSSQFISSRTYFANKVTDREGWGKGGGWEGSATAIMDMLLHASHVMNSGGCANLALKGCNSMLLQLLSSECRLTTPALPMKNNNMPLLLHQNLVYLGS